MSAKPKTPAAPDRFGSQIPFCEPYWYQGFPSPYYTEAHKAFRAKVRKFVEEEIRPNVEKWIKEGYPKILHEKAYAAGLGGYLYPKEIGGNRPDDFDAFYELIMCDEMSRIGGGGILGQAAINSMAMPPILNAGTPEMKRICREVVQGKKHICLAISEPYAGSDVAGIKTSARKTEDGKYYVVNGMKQWITGGLMADYFTLAVRTGGEGFAGISLLFVDRNIPGISIRKMETQFDNAHSTTFIEFADVKVPTTALIGEENAGFMMILTNFNHERFVISAGASRAARLCYSEAFTYAMERQTFGKKLISHQIIRFKLAEMARQIETLHDNLERVAYSFSNGISDFKMGGACALLKVQASKTFEYCAREASQILGGNSIVKEGRGKLVERLYRDVRATAIPGGSEEILLDFAMRQAASKASKIAQESQINSKL